MDFVQNRKANRLNQASTNYNTAATNTSFHGNSQQLLQTQLQESIQGDNNLYHHGSSIDHSGPQRIRYHDDDDGDRFDSLNDLSANLSFQQELDSLKRELAGNSETRSDTLQLTGKKQKPLKKNATAGGMKGSNMNRHQSAPTLNDNNSSVARSSVASDNPQSLYQSASASELNQRLSALSATAYGHTSPVPVNTGMTAAEAKIAALIDMNMQEIQAQRIAATATETSQSVGKDRGTGRQKDPLISGKKVKQQSLVRKSQTTSALGSPSLNASLDMGSFTSLEGSNSGVLKQASRTLGNAVIQLPPVHGGSKPQQSR